MSKRSPLETLTHQVGAAIEEEGGRLVVQTVGHLDDEITLLRDGVGLADVSDWTRVLLEGEGKAATAVIRTAFGLDPPAIGGGVRASESDLFRLRWDQYFLIGPAGSESYLVSLLERAAVEREVLVSVTDLTDGHAGLLVAGRFSAGLLSRLCGLDFHPAAFPDWTAAAGSVAKTRQTIVRRDLGRVPAFLLSGGRSYGPYLWRAMLDAGRDVGLRHVGRQALEAMTV